MIAHLLQEGATVDTAIQDARGMCYVIPIQEQVGFARKLAAAAATTTVASAVNWKGIDLGRLLLGFLWRYGYAFNWDAHCVSVRRGGIVTRQSSLLNTEPGRLSLEDPQVCLFYIHILNCIQKMTEESSLFSHPSKSPHLGNANSVAYNS